MDKEVIYGVIGCCYLFILSIQDIRRNMVSGLFLAAGGLAATIVQIIFRSQAVEHTVGGFIIGFIFMGISWITKEALGYGDSFLIMIIGIYIGIWNLISVLLISFLFAAAYSMGSLVRHRFCRKKVLPFIPFLTVGYVVFILLEVL